MGRKFEYFCDVCGKSFENKRHLNIKQGKLYISYFGEHEHYPNINDSMGETWRQKEVKFGCNELHFCNVNCMMLYIGNRIKTVERELRR